MMSPYANDCIGRQIRRQIICIERHLIYLPRHIGEAAGAQLLEEYLSKNLWDQKRVFQAFF
jgi:hypothetical protein